ncbi:hypothetical protein HUU39_21080 [candidate division KSB1 bacterium]|nr:hypothetical protein [bacterium]NUM67729.1 hypothetical protein [candidate division KSB1 bacterium]
MTVEFAFVLDLVALAVVLFAIMQLPVARGIFCDDGFDQHLVCQRHAA